MKELRHTLGQVRIEERDGAAPVIEGYSAKFNEVEVIYGMFTESINQRAFDSSLAANKNGDQDTKALFDHNSAYILGRSGNGTLSMKTDSKGLFSTIFPNVAVSYAKDLVENIRSGTIHGQSFAFTVREAKWKFGAQEAQMDHREIMDIGELYDVGPVTYPAYESTTIGVRSEAQEQQKSVRAFAEEFRKSNHVGLFELSIVETVDPANQFVESRDGFCLTITPSVLVSREIPKLKKSTPVSILREKLKIAAQGY